MSSPTIYESKREQVRAIRGFHLHLLGYIIINAGLITTCFVTSPGSSWFYWPLVSWGVGLALHGACVYTGKRFWPVSWESRWSRT
jgi:two-component system, LytTR family, sensor kinase